ncbi:MAG: hypothetical protein QOF10_2445 [Kribbellaceae bacterium]|nr:hypothetical protein [Kribbellaceae bacterium]
MAKPRRPRSAVAAPRKLVCYVTLAVDVSAVPASDRVELIREMIWHNVVRVDIQHHSEPQDIRLVGAIADVGRVTVCSIRTNAVTVTRTPRLANDELEPCVFLGLQVSGSSMVVQHGRQALLQQGEFAIYESTSPYTLLNDAGLDVHYFRIPRSDLALPSNAITKVTAVRLSRENAVADLAATYFKRLAENHQRLAGPNADSVGQPSIELVRAVIATQLDEPQLAREPLESTLYLRIMEYVRAHLAEHDLTAAEIAHRHNISVRQLYTILSRSGITLGEWLRAHRLEECRKDLARPGARSVSIAYIAHRWGFVNETHFSRVFRETYGMSPRDWRELCRRNQAP